MCLNVWIFFFFAYRKSTFFLRIPASWLLWDHGRRRSSVEFQTPSRRLGVPARLPDGAGHPPARRWLRVFPICIPATARRHTPARPLPVSLATWNVTSTQEILSPKLTYVLMISWFPIWVSFYFIAWISASDMPTFLLVSICVWHVGLFWRHTHIWDVI